ncbi:protein kinase 4-like [Macrosteles quadrilineatus]|uniref:protein kinase 4-like n=1 Tax=Macrosteles quadrilineatus TaxID=74068 RepID=UPI0023E16511|nr:protein kinase 4-like [Macrosteles quadrilineatus]
MTDTVDNVQVLTDNLSDNNNTSTFTQHSSFVNPAQPDNVITQHEVEQSNNLPGHNNNELFTEFNKTEAEVNMTDAISRAETGNRHLECQGQQKQQQLPPIPDFADDNTRTPPKTSDVIPSHSPSTLTRQLILTNSNYDVTTSVNASPTKTTVVTDDFQCKLISLFELLGNKIDKGLNEVKTEVASVENKLNKGLNDVKNEVKNELNTKFNTLSENQNNMRKELDEIRAIQQVQTLELQQIEHNIIKKVYKQNDEIRKEVSNIVANERIKTNQIITDESHKIETKLTLNINETSQNTKSDLENYVNLKTTEIRNELAPVVEYNQNTILQTTETLNQVTNLIQEQEAKFTNIKADLEQKLKQETTFLPPQIHVTCGSSILTNDLTLPKFSGRSHNPPEYLTRLKRYYQKLLSRQSTEQNPIEILKDVLETSLEHQASRWFSLVKNDLKSWEDFETQFISKYWNRNLQRAIKHKIESEQYKPNGKLTRSEYFIERVITLRSLTPALTEDEIVAILSDHFCPLIQDARRVQNASSVYEFEAILQRQDLHDAEKRPKNNSSPTPSHNNQNRNDHPNNYHNNRRNYQNRPSFQAQNHYQNTNPHTYNPKIEKSQYYQNHRPQHNPSWQPRNPPPPQQQRGNVNYMTVTHNPQHNTNQFHDREYPTSEQVQMCNSISQVPSQHRPPNSTTQPYSGQPPLNG